MTKEQFHAKFAGRMLLFLTEAWTARKAPPSELGLLMDDHARQLRSLLGEMYEALTPPQPAPAPRAAANGAAPAKAQPGRPV